MQKLPELPSEELTTRLSVLIEPKKKACFEALCMVEDVKPSQVVCQLIQEYIEARVGPEWRGVILGSADNNFWIYPYLEDQLSSVHESLIRHIRIGFRYQNGDSVI